MRNTYALDMQIQQKLPQYDSLSLIFGIPVHFDDAWCHSVTHPIVFNTLMATKMEIYSYQHEELLYFF